MKGRLIEHSLTVFLVTLAFGVLVAVAVDREASQQSTRVKILEPYLHLEPLDFGNPLHRALFLETLNLFYPASRARNDSLLEEIENFRQEQFTNKAYKTGGEEHGFSTANVLRLGSMYVQFILVYVVVMVLSYHAAQSLALLRFIKMKQRRMSYLAALSGLIGQLRSGERDVSRYLTFLSLIVKALIKGMAYSVLFAPAYVIAYSMRTRFDTESYLFVMVLAVVSNGLLISSVNRFYTFLVAESRKGYVQTAMVKNLHASYAWKTADGISYASILHPKSLLPSHLLRHIYLNARYQYLPALKEHASFLITSLIIIEMALNIQGHLGYELLQNILNKEYEVAAGILVGIFLIVKATEIAVDVWFSRESRKYDNRI